MSTDKIKQRIVYVLTRKNKSDDDDTDIYVGSTSRSLEQRLCCHRCDAIRPGNENNRLYKRMREVGLENWEIFPLLSRACGIKTIREVERKWVRILSADLNSYLPIREEETISQYMAAYYENNKETILQRQAARYENNIRTKRFYCKVCALACRTNHDLKKHLDTLKHSYNYLNSLD